MKINFLKFKRKLLRIKIFKMILAGVAAGCMAFGASLILSKFAIVGFEPMISLPIGVGAALVTSLVMFFVLRTTDKKLAEDLDRRFGLKEKVQTMIEYDGGGGAILELQRQDAENALSEIKIKKYRARRLWIYIVAFVLGAALTVTAVFIRNRRDDVPKEVIVPFELTAMKERGLEELIKYVETSEMESEYRVIVADTLKQLLADLKATKTEPEMQMHLAKAMDAILEATKDSSSSAEILNALWNTGDQSLRKLAKALDTSEWGVEEPENWGSYADKLNVFREDIKNCGIAEVEEDSEEPLPQKPKLTNYLEMRSSRAVRALLDSHIPDDDAIYSAISKLVGDGEYEYDGKKIYGFAKIGEMGASLPEEEVLLMIDAAFDGMSNEIFEAIKQKKTNTNVGEYTLLKLSDLFLVPLPEFERPDFVKNGDTDGGNSDTGGKDDDTAGGTSGGVGMGSIYGSNDLVLDPLTGEYVEYGTLLDKYFAVMDSKLSDGNYTELQKEAIIKYFALLYGGMDKEEGNPK